MSLLEIRNLHAEVDGHEILKGIDLTIHPGEVHSIMGPNGSGKSTLAQVLSRRDAYDVTEGEVLFNGKNLLEMKPEEAAREGVFLAFQYPVEIPGIGNAYFLRSALNAIRAHRGEDAPQDRTGDSDDPQARANHNTEGGIECELDEKKPAQASCSIVQGGGCLLQIMRARQFDETVSQIFAL